MRGPLTWPGLVLALALAIAVPAGLSLIIAAVIAGPGTMLSKPVGQQVVALAPTPPVVVPAPGLAGAPRSALPLPAPPLPVASSHGPSTSPRHFDVRIVEGSMSEPKSWGFDPPTLTVRVGDTITWTNAGGLPHTITADDGSFDSGVLAKTAAWSFTPTVAGAFSYFCALHPSMKGVLVVEAVNEAVAAATPTVGVRDESERSHPANHSTPSPSTGSQEMQAAPVKPGRRQIGAQIVADGFTPATITVAVGDTVTWTNTDNWKHTVTARDVSFDSGTIEVGARWSFTAVRPGTFPYFCEFHPEMVGTFIVTEGASQGVGATTQPVTTSTPVRAAQVTPPGTTPTPTAKPSGPSGGQQVSAQIVDGGFNPSTITVAVGDTVTWANTDSRKHTVTAEGGVFDSGILSAGARWSYTPTSPGTFAYFCDLHPEMRGTLVVTASGEAPAPGPQPPAGPSTGTGSPLTPPLAATPGKVEIALDGSSAFSSAVGRARYENDGGKRRLRVEVEKVAAPTGTALIVVVDGSQIGDMALADDGRARLELEDGPTIPTSVAGKLLEVKASGGELVASGRFP